MRVFNKNLINVAKKTLTFNYFRNQQSCTQSLNIISQSRNMATNTIPLHTNRLAQEKSTYLLQHAHNPVDWYPWGDEAIEKARAEGKLIFLSVGYSTCHWCHVMEKESFENEAVAKIMNEHFVNIKVDREERPDIDKIYMNFVLMINGSGGWPMSVWLTPDLAPISAGTYFPPTDRWGMPGFTTVLQKVHSKWCSDKNQIKEVGKKIIDVMQTHTSEAKNTNEESALQTAEAKFDEAVKIYKRNADSEYGGFGTSPKFPEVSKLNFLLHAAIQRPDPNVLKIPLDTLQKIDEGGIHDHVFGGFARYSVDRKWHIPHFEKMLYDQGQLLMAYTNAYKITSNPRYLEVSDRIFKYICKDLYHPGGGFYCGEDADSYREFGDTDKVEGAFYAWSFDELEQLIKYNKELQSNSFDIYCEYYGIEDSGNVDASSDPHGHLTLQNILMVQTSIDSIAEKYNMTTNAVQELLNQINQLLYVVRAKRPRPHLDTKILTAWNGLILSGISKLACIPNSTNREEYLRVATKLVGFLKQFHYDSTQKNLWRACYGESTESTSATLLADPVHGFLDDYAFLVKGLLDYYAATLDQSALDWAAELQNTQDRLFWDSTNFGYFYSQANAANVVLRLKDDSDGAEPCGNSVAASNLQLLAEYFENDTFKRNSTQLFQYFSGTTPFGYVLPEMMSALLLYDTGLPTFVFVGPKDDLMGQLLDSVRSFYIPGVVLFQYDPNSNVTLTKASIKEHYKMVDNKTTVYVCHKNVCEPPIHSIEDLETSLKSKYFFSI